MAEGYLLDTGVVLRWFLPQDGFEHAREVRDRFLAGSVRVESVDRVRMELGDVLRKRGLLTQRIDEETYVTAARSLDDLEIRVHVTDVDAIERVARLTARRMISFYDGIIVDRAIQQRLTLLTSDAKLVKAVDGLLSTELLRGVGAKG